MKILFLTPWYPDAENPNHGIFVRDQALAIVRGHEVWVVSCKVNYSAFGLSSATGSHTRFQGLRESRIVIKRSLPVFNQLNFFLRATVATLKIAREFRPDIIHGNIGYPGAFWSWIVSRFLKIPYVLTEHTRITNNFRSSIHKRLTLFGYERARKVIAVSQWHAGEISSIASKTPVVIHNVIDFAKFPVIAVRPDVNEFQIGFLGGMNTPVKGLDILLRAAANLNERFKLHIGGEGELLGHYQSLAKELEISDKCYFHGGVPHEEVSLFMSKLHFFVSASRSETFGVAMVEALASGLPVVATGSGGPRDFITPQNGILVEVENVQQLAEGMADVMRNFQRYNPHVIRNTVITRFSAERFLVEIEKVYDEVRVMT